MSSNLTVISSSSSSYPDDSESASFDIVIFSDLDFCPNPFLTNSPAFEWQSCCDTNLLKSCMLVGIPHFIAYMWLIYYFAYKISNLNKNC